MASAVREPGPPEAVASVVEVAPSAAAVAEAFPEGAVPLAAAVAAAFRVAPAGAALVVAAERERRDLSCLIG